MIDLTLPQLTTVREILSRFVPACDVRAFGSRVAGGARTYSDLDLAIYAPGPLDFDTLWRLQEAFEDSELPFRVDIVDAHTLTPEFRGAMEAQSAPVRTQPAAAKR